jgi:hypothetical protein
VCRVQAADAHHALKISKLTCCSGSSWRRRVWGDRSGVARRRCRGASTPPDSGLKKPPPAAAAASAVPSAKAPAQDDTTLLTP